MLRALLLLLLVPLSSSAADAVSFSHDVAAILSRAGCNSGACHGNLNGKGGLKLSLRGEDPASDYITLTRTMLARRLDVASPDESLLLKKATGRVPHEGGSRFSANSPEYHAVRSWIARGADSDVDNAVAVKSLTVTPQRAIVIAPANQVKLTVTAELANGTRRDVTALCAMETVTLGIASIANGVVHKENPGETVVLVRYLQHQLPVRVAFLNDVPKPDVSVLTSSHPIDKHVARQLTELRIPPATLTSDEQFIRRAFLDACGMIPPADVVKKFLADRSPRKREQLIDALLTRQEFDEYWGMKWSDVLRNEEKSLDKKGVQVFHRWITNWVAEDRPLTDFAREIVSARGSTYANPPTNFFRAVRDPYNRAEAVAQVFLGVRVSCARCHNHPFDRWTQDDYHRFAAFFNQVQYRVLSNDKRDALDKHEFIGEQIVYTTRSGHSTLPRTSEPALPKTLGDDQQPANDDRLGMLANWIAADNNPFFAKAQANRIWSHLFGRGLVEPNDDFKAANPPANPELMEHLAAEFQRGGSRLKPLVRHIMLSRTYQLAASTNELNEHDESNFSHSLIQPLEAEQLLDGMSRVFGVSAEFRGYPRGVRAGAVPAMSQTGRRAGSPTMSERFLTVFGKPERLLTCDCERSSDAGLLQAFQMINGEQVNLMLQKPDNLLGKRIAAGETDAAMLDAFYLSALSRYPTTAERTKLLAYVAMASDRRRAWEDVLWGIVNSKEFLLRR